MKQFCLALGLKDDDELIRNMKNIIRRCFRRLIF